MTNQTQINELKLALEWARSDLRLEANSRNRYKVIDLENRLRRLVETGSEFANAQPVTYYADHV